MNRILAVFVALLALAPALGGCRDACYSLADRICTCEPTPADRANCRVERITSQQGQVSIEESDIAFCEAKLETCDCAAIDENRLDACGFVGEGEQ